MRKPFDGYFPVTQDFGNKLKLNGIDWYGQWGLLGHNGIDYGTPAWTPILAPHKGKIIEARYDASYGNYVKIENDKEGSVLAHFARLSVTAGDYVEEGQIIGYSGNTGGSTGPHLHWGYYRKPRNRSNGFNGFEDQTQYIISLPTSDMTELERKKLVQFDRTTIALYEAGLIPTNASEYFFENPEDENKFTNQIKTLIRDGKPNSGLADKLAKHEAKCQEEKEQLLVKIIKLVKDLS